MRSAPPKPVSLDAILSAMIRRAEQSRDPATRAWLPRLRRLVVSSERAGKGAPECR